MAISIIASRPSFKPLIEYARKATKAKEVIHGGNNLGLDPETATASQLAGACDAIASTNPDITNPAISIILRASDEKNLTVEQYTDMAKHVLKDLGFITETAEAPFVIELHRDPVTKKDLHVHIITSKVRNDGSVVSLNQDRLRLQASVRAFEQENRLEHVPALRGNIFVPKAEVEMGLKYGHTPPRLAIGLACKEAIPAAEDLARRYVAEQERRKRMAAFSPISAIGDAERELAAQATMETVFPIIYGDELKKRSVLVSYKHETLSTGDLSPILGVSYDLIGYDGPMASHFAGSHIHVGKDDRDVEDDKVVIENCGWGQISRLWDGQTRAQGQLIADRTADRIMRAVREAIPLARDGLEAWQKQNSSPETAAGAVARGVMEQAREAKIQQLFEHALLERGVRTDFYRKTTVSGEQISGVSYASLHDPAGHIYAGYELDALARKQRDRERASAGVAMEYMDQRKDGTPAKHRDFTWPSIVNQARMPARPPSDPPDTLRRVMADQPALVAVGAPDDRAEHPPMRQGDERGGDDAAAPGPLAYAPMDDELPAAIRIGGTVRAVLDMSLAHVRDDILHGSLAAESKARVRRVGHMAVVTRVCRELERRGVQVDVEVSPQEQSDADMPQQEVDDAAERQGRARGGMEQLVYRIRDGDRYAGGDIGLPWDRIKREIRDTVRAAIKERERIQAVELAASPSVPDDPSITAPTTDASPTDREGARSLISAAIPAAVATAGARVSAWRRDPESGLLLPRDAAAVELDMFYDAFDAELRERHVVRAVDEDRDGVWRVKYRVDGGTPDMDAHRFAEDEVGYPWQAIVVYGRKMIASGQSVIPIRALDVQEMLAAAREEAGARPTPHIDAPDRAPASVEERHEQPASGGYLTVTPREQARAGMPSASGEPGAAAEASQDRERERAVGRIAAAMRVHEADPEWAIIAAAAEQDAAGPGDDLETLALGRIYAARLAAALHPAAHPRLPLSALMQGFKNHSLDHLTPYEPLDAYLRAVEIEGLTALLARDDDPSLRLHAHLHRVIAEAMKVAARDRVMRGLRGTAGERADMADLEAVAAAMPAHVPPARSVDDLARATWQNLYAAKLRDNPRLRTDEDMTVPARVDALKRLLAAVAPPPDVDKMARDVVIRELQSVVAKRIGDAERIAPAHPAAQTIKDAVKQATVVAARNGWDTVTIRAVEAAAMDLWRANHPDTGRGDTGDTAARGRA